LAPFFFGADLGRAIWGLAIIVGVLAVLVVLEMDFFQRRPGQIGEALAVTAGVAAGAGIWWFFRKRLAPFFGLCLIIAGMLAAAAVFDYFGSN
jgi:hypothetical protein